MAQSSDGYVGERTVLRAAVAVLAAAMVTGLGYGYSTLAGDVGRVMANDRTNTERLVRVETILERIERKIDQR